ncbi:MAG: HAD family hydrolase [Sedimentisphaerales bacterium]|nr:HAD family hydrolase [Sedimentisphaerales bacterium]
MFKAVVFDFGQTLVDSADGFRRAEKEAQAKIFGDLAFTDKDEFLKGYRRIRREFHAQSKLSRVKIWEEVYWFFCRQADMEKLMQWEQEYWQRVKELTRVFDETVGVLGELQRRYKLALVTNTQGQRSGNEHRISLYPELEKFFEVVVVAGEGGIPAKPRIEAFSVCLEQLKVSAAEAVYVGDDYRNDVEGATAAGMKAVWLKHHSVVRNWPDVEPEVPVISSLEELLDLEKIFS